MESKRADSMANPLAILRRSVYRRLLPLSLAACSVAACVLVSTGCSSSGPRNVAGNASSSASAQTTSAIPADTASDPASAASTASAVGAESDPDTDLDGNGKVDLAKFLTPSSTHGPKDAACVALFGSGARHVVRGQSDGRAVHAGVL